MQVYTCQKAPLLEITCRGSFDVAEQAGLCMTLLKTPKKGFLGSWPN